MKVTFETMPRAIEELYEKLERIEAALSSPEPETPLNDTMLIDEAIQFLKENGRPTSKSTIYKESSLGWIPAHRVGKRLVFSRKELRTWIDEGLPKRIEQEATDLLSSRMNRYENATDRLIKTRRA
jgi:hypothetical protein